MSKELYDFIVTVINNTKLNDVFANYIETLSNLDKKEALKISRLVRSNNFLELVKTLDISKYDVESFKRNVL
jgi:hypothetical protein